MPSTPARRDSNADRPGHGACTVVDASMNILNCTVGSGILALAFALKECGLGLGIILSIVVAFLSWFALYILILSGQRIGVYRSYAMLCEATMGTTGFYMLNAVIFFQSAGACITYMIVIGDTVPLVLTVLGFETNRQWVIFISSILFILPLLFYRTIGSLAKVSTISVMTLPLILIAVAVRGFHYAPEHHKDYEFIGDNVFPAIGVMAFAMLSTQTAFPNYLSLKRPSMEAWGQATGMAVGASWIISFVFAIIGYMSFGEDVAANIFNSFPATDGLVNFGRILLGFSMYLTFPQAFYPARGALHKVLGHENTFVYPTETEHLATTIGLFVPILICGIVVTDLGVLYQLIGGFCSTFLAYIFPALCYLLVFWSKEERQLWAARAIMAEGSSEQDEDELDQDDEESDDQEEGKKLSKDHKGSAIHTLSYTHTHTQAHVHPESVPILASSHLGTGAARSGSSAAQYSTMARSDSDLSAQISLSSSHGGPSSSKHRRRATETRPWIDAAAVVLLVFGVFVMVVSTSLTLKKMTGHL